MWKKRLVLLGRALLSKTRSNENDTKHLLDAVARLEEALFDLEPMVAKIGVSVVGSEEVVVSLAVYSLRSRQGFALE